MAAGRTVRNALTFDVEEYFHAEAFSGLIRPEEWSRFPSRVAESTRRILDLVGRAGVSATFFILGWVAERHPDLVRQIRAEGHEIACHGHGHRLIYRMGREAFRSDVRRAKQALEDAGGVAVLGYRAPTFSVIRKTLWALDVLAEEGFRYDSSVFPIYHDRYGIPDAPRFPYRVPVAAGVDLIEFPISTLSVGGQHVPFSGGGYFRLLPYLVVRRAVGRVNGVEGRPVIVYLHPWEFDPDQPRLPLRRVARLRHYVNLRHTGRKLDRLLADFAFGPAATVLRAVGFAEALA